MNVLIPLNTANEVTLELIDLINRKHRSETNGARIPIIYHYQRVLKNAIIYHNVRCFHQQLSAAVCSLNQAA